MFMEEGMDYIITACTNVKPQLEQKNIDMALKLAYSRFVPIAKEIREIYMNLQHFFEQYTLSKGLCLDD